MQNLVIIGNGIAGITTARHVRKMSDMKITIISSETKYFFSRTALMYVYMGHMRFKEIKPYEDWFWAKNNIDLIYAHVNYIDTDKKNLQLNNGSIIPYDKLVIATGSKTNKFGWPGQDLPGVQGLYNWQDVELLEENTKNISHAVIVGGGLIGIELAEMLHSRNIHVTFLVRENLYWSNILPKEDSILICRHIIEHGFSLKLGIQLKEIKAGENGRVKSIITDKDEEIECQLVGLTPGVHPNIEMVKNSKVETNRGVLVNDFLETNIPDVYAAGDCVEFKERELGRFRFEQLWYTGRMHGEALAQTICGKRTKYDRGIWFNSAKFLDIEYQTYGFVAAQPREGESNFYWEHKSGKKAVHFVYKSDDHSIVGMNTFGIRYRQEFFEKCIKNKKTIEYVLEHLPNANFDPEFFERHEKEIIEKFNSDNPGANLELKSKKRFEEFTEKGNSMTPIQIEPFKVYKNNSRLEWIKKTGLGVFLTGVFFLLVSLTGTAMIMPNLFLFLSFGLSIIGAVTYSLPVIWEAPAGIKNNKIFFNGFTSRGAIAWIAGIIITAFYFFLYWFPSFIENWIRLVDPLSYFLRGEKADRWFLYGTFYTLAVLFMGLKMIIKYRHNRYHIVRTFSVMFFQLGFAYLIPALLIMFNKPEHYFSYFWPLKYQYLFPNNINYLTHTAGALGYFMVFWGAAMTFIAAPVLSYFFGKRWYCSWVCGCGGLAETAGDPFRHLSDKSLKTWKIERWSIHSVLVFVVVTTALLWINSASEGKVLGGLSQTFSSVYGFLIGAVFSGIVGVGFYPLMGSRVWCRFGCPLAAILGLFQRFRSKFRITTNGGQCISCGNCSTYCEMGIDVRAYAQRKQNIIRSSCVGCGVCAAVCPRGVLKLENGPEKGRYNVVLDDKLIQAND